MRGESLVIVGWAEGRGASASALGCAPLNPTYEEVSLPRRINVVEY